MAQLQWALTCRDYIISQEHNAVTYRDSVERLTSDSFPTPLPTLFYVAMLWRREIVDEPEISRARVVAQNVNGDVAGITGPTVIDLETYDRFRIHLLNPEFQVSDPGRVWFLVQQERDAGWETENALPIDIVYTTPEPQNGDAAAAEGRV